MISTEDFSRLSAELSALELDFFVWARDHGIDEETVTHLGESFMDNLSAKIEMQVRMEVEARKETGEEMPRFGAFDPAPAMKAMFLQVFVFGWEAAVQYGNNQDV